MEKIVDLHNLISDISRCEKLTPETKTEIYKFIAANYVASQFCGIFNKFTDKFNGYYGKLEKELQLQQS